MATKKTTLTGLATTVPFDRFWTWLQQHPNCVLRAGTPEAALFDDDDFHWHFTVEDPQTYLVQVLRGKHTIGELVLTPQEIAYVQAEPSEPGGEEFLFECISEGEAARVAVAYFVMSHAFDEHEPATPGRWTH